MERKNINCARDCSLYCLGRHLCPHCDADLPSSFQFNAPLMPPSAAAIQGYNQGRVKELSEKLLTVEDIYKTFKKNLTSSRLRTAFFEGVYLPSLSAEKQKINRDALLKRFNTILSVKKGAANADPEPYTVTVELDDPVVAAEWVQDYIERAIAATKLELRNTIEAEQKVRVNALSIQKRALLGTAKQKREDQIGRASCRERV